MQPAEQQPQPEEGSVGASDTNGEQAMTPPLFEFLSGMEAPREPPPPEEAAAAPLQSAAPAYTETDMQAFEQAVRQGLIYPPPPSYYLNISHVVEQPAPVAPAAHAPVQPQPQPFAAPPARPAVPPPAKRSRKWLWIVISILAAAIVASCGLCGWGIYTFVSPIVQGTSNSLQVVDDFYSNLQNQRYQAAYSDLVMPQMTLAQFTKEAQQADQQNGPIQSYTPQQPSVNFNSNNGPDLSQFSYAVNVTRAHSSYTALLIVRQEGKQWKITSFDRL